MSATFKIKLTRDFTVMTNHHLRNKNLSLKAKGLQSIMLSLPDDWDYTIAGLTKLSKDGRDAIIAALKELEDEGYLIRNRKRNEKGQVTDSEYIISEYPMTEKPITENPTQVKPTQEKPIEENPTQLNTNISNTNISNTKSINHSINKANVGIACGKPVENFEEVERQVREQIDYSNLCTAHDKSTIDGIVSLISEVYVSANDIYIGKQKMPYKVIQAMYEKIDYDCIVYVLDCLKETSQNSKIKNMKSYLMTALYNAPLTIGVYYDAEANHDMNNTQKS